MDGRAILILCCDLPPLLVRFIPGDLTDNAGQWPASIPLYGPNTKAGGVNMSTAAVTAERIIVRAVKRQVAHRAGLAGK
jgi:hypothetical protein